MKSQGRPLISFDWAMKRLLRQKANFDILEGFLTELLKQDIKISNILESEGNKEDKDDKYNQVDILCENSHKELILIEMQFSNEYDYFHRMLYGTSKLITEYMSESYEYKEVKKVYSINIVYFKLGQGTDYVYRGTTEFRGIHNNDILQVSERQKELYKHDEVAKIYPEYYIIKVNQFNDVAKDTLDEWIFYLKNSVMPNDFKAKGLAQVEEKLRKDAMTVEERQNYERHRKSNAIAKSEWETALDEKVVKIAKSLLTAKTPIEIISNATGLSVEEIEKLK